MVFSGFFFDFPCTLKGIYTFVIDILVLNSPFSYLHMCPSHRIRPPLLVQRQKWSLPTEFCGSGRSQAWWQPRKKMGQGV